MTLTAAITTARALHRDDTPGHVNLHDLLHACTVLHHNPDHVGLMITDTHPAADFVFHIGMMRGAATALSRAAVTAPWWPRRRARAIAARLSLRAYEHSESFTRFAALPGTSTWHANGYLSGHALIQNALISQTEHLTADQHAALSAGPTTTPAPQHHP